MKEGRAAKTARGIYFLLLQLGRKFVRARRATWIKTCESDRLPPILEDVLVAVRVDEGEWIDMAFWDGSVWRVSGSCECKITPLAWMFLPRFPDSVK